jgi:hypothetical protein
MTIADLWWFDACRLFSTHRAGAHHKFLISDLGVAAQTN